jgi:hypothetical protein
METGVLTELDEETRSFLLRRRAKTSSSSLALTTGEGIVAGLIAGTSPLQACIPHPR